MQRPRRSLVWLALALAACGGRAPDADPGLAPIAELGAPDPPDPATTPVALERAGDPTEVGVARSGVPAPVLDASRDGAERAGAGLRVSGQLVAPDGSPVSGQFWVLRDGRSACRPRYVPGTNDHRFEFEVREPGTYRLVAAVPGVGSAILPELFLHPDASREAPLAVPLAGPGRLAGVLRDSGGQSLPNVPLLAVQDAPDLDPGAPPAREPGDVRAGGLRWTACRTDEDGRYELAGLAPGRYHVRADPFEREDHERWYHEGRYPVSLTSEPVPHDAPERDLAYPLHRVQVRVLEVDGVPVAFDPRPSPPEERPASPVRHVWVHPVGEADAHRDDRGRTTWVPTGDPTTWELRVEPDHTYALAVASRGRPYALGQVEVPHGQADQALAIRLPVSRDPGRVVLHVDPPSWGGEDRPKFERFNGVTATLFALPGEVPLWEPWADPGEPLSLTLPPGRYRLDLHPRAGFVGCGTGMVGDGLPALPRPIRFEFELTSHQLLERTVAFQPAGRISVRLVAEDPGDHLPDTRVRIVARDAEGRDHALGFREPRPDPHAAGPEWLAVRFHDVDGLRPGDRRTCANELPPATYTVHADLPGFVVEPVEVVVRDREEPTVELVLRRR